MFFPIWKRLFAGTLPTNKNLFAGTLPANKNLFAGTPQVGSIYIFDPRNGLYGQKKWPLVMLVFQLRRFKIVFLAPCKRNGKRCSDHKMPVYKISWLKRLDSMDHWVRLVWITWGLENPNKLLAGLYAFMCGMQPQIWRALSTQW